MDHQPLCRSWAKSYTLFDEDLVWTTNNCVEAGQGRIHYLMSWDGPSTIVPKLGQVDTPLLTTVADSSGERDTGGISSGSPTFTCENSATAASSAKPFHPCVSYSSSYSTSSHHMPPSRTRRRSCSGEAPSCSSCLHEKKKKKCYTKNKQNEHKKVQQNQK